MSTPQIIGTSHSIVQRDGQTYIAVDGMTPDQIIVWLHDHHRAKAFGAIRRAAEVARELDAEASAMWDDLKEDDDPDWLEVQSEAIRYAIRAAIGSPKA